LTATTIKNFSDRTWLEKLVLSKTFWLIFTLMGFTYPIVKTVYRELPPELPRYHIVPNFELTSNHGQPFGSKNLNGKVYMATFAFTSCPTTCPALMEKMQLVQKRVRGLGQKIAIVTYTVDPETDTPQLLKKHADKVQANPYIWTFLTGEKQQLKDLLIDGYKVPMGEEEEIQGVVDGDAVSLMDIAHSNKIVLVDDKSAVRGYYSTDKAGINKLMIDVGLLVNRKN
jgi:protein SCO1